jgi:hypothetical protein
VRKSNVNKQGKVEFLRLLFSKRGIITNASSTGADSRGSISSSERQGLRERRARNDAEGIAGYLEQRLLRTVAEALATPLSPRQLGLAASATVTSVGQARLLALVNSELTSSYADATLDAYDELGVQTVAIEAEWSALTAACSFCSSQDGEEYALEDAYGVLPLHPGCRCDWVPVDRYLV